MARIVPVEPVVDEIKRKAREALFARLKSQPPIDIGPWTRDELYDE